MYCNVHMTSPCLCGYDYDYVSMYSASLRVKSSAPRREPPHEASCCCNYNPFTDETKDNEIHDLEFALRKLAVMKCQMKKWRMERLQLESETRSLKNKLQSLGVNVNEPVTEEPLIIHYRDENRRLEKIREQLEDKIKDLETTINDHELYKNPCAGIQIIRENMRALREQSHREKKKFDEIIRELTIKLAESGGESPCAGVNRLREKLRELIDPHGEKMILSRNQQSGTTVAKSIETLTALSKSCDDLRVENGRIRVEEQNLRRALRPTGDDVHVHSDDVRMHSVIIDQLKNDRITVDNNITEEDNAIRSLQERMSDDAEKMRINHESLTTEESGIDARKDSEGQRLTNDSQLSEEDAQTMGKKIDDIGIETLDSKIELIKDTNEKEKLQDDVDGLNNTVETLMSKLVSSDALKDSALLELTTLRKELDQLIINLDDSQRDNSNLRTERDMLKHQIVEIQEELSNKIADNVDLRKSIDKPTSKLNELQLENETLKTKIVELEQVINNFNTENSIDALEIDKLHRELENTKQDLESSHNRMSKLDDELSRSQLENHELDVLHEALTEEKLAKDIALDKINNFNEELHALKSELMNCRNENEKLLNDLNDTKQECMQLDKASSNFQSEVEALRSYNEKLKSGNELLKRDLISAQGDSQIQKIEADALKIDNAALKGEGDRLRSENSNIRTDLTNLKNINENLSSELESWKSDSMKCYAERDRLTAELKKFGDEYAKNKNEYDSSTRELEILRKAHDNSENQVRNLQSSLNALQLEKESLLTALNSMRVEVDEMKKNVIGKDIELKEATVAKHELVALKNELNKCREELERCNRGLDSSKKQIDTLKSENKIAQEQLIMADKKIGADEFRKHIVDERDALKKQLDEARRSIGQIKADAAPKNALLEEMDALKNTLGKLRKDLEKCNMENERLHRELDEWQNDAGKSKIEFEQVKNENIKFVGEVKAVRNELSHLNHEMGEMKLHNGRLEEDILKMREEIEHITAERNKLEAENGAMKVEKAELLREHQENSDEPKNYVDDVEKQEREIQRLRMENNQFRNELETAREELKSVSMHDGKIAVGEGKHKEDVSVVRVEHGNLEDPTKDTEYLKRENKKLSKNLQKLKNDIDKFKTENETLKAEIDDSSKLNEAFVELEKWRRIAEDLTREIIVLNNNLEKAKEDLDEITCASEKMIVTADSLQGESEYIQPKDVKQWQKEVKRMNTEIQQLKKENEILKNNRDVPSTMQRLLDELTEWKKKAEDLKEENIKMKSNFEKVRTDDEQPKRDMQLRRPSQISRERPVTQILSDAPDMSNELIRALDVIRMKMEKQRKGVIRIRENIDNMAKQISPDSSKYCDSDDSIVLNTMNPITGEVLEISNDLSTNILSAEKELINFAKVWKARWQENAHLKKLVEDSRGVGSSKTPGLSAEKTGTDSGSFDPESWLASLTLTQLAELHDKICLLTSNLVGKDSFPAVCKKPEDTPSPSHNQNNLQQSYEVLNRKIAALQRQIAEKQTEAGMKVFEMRQILRREQAEVIRISEAMSQEKKRNLMLHFSFDESFCCVNECTAKCARNVKFISKNGAREKL